MLTHAGFSYLHDQDAPPPPFLSAWKEALGGYPRTAVRTESGAVCALDWDGTLSRWSAAKPSSQKVSVSADARELLALGDACVVVSEKEGVTAYRDDGLHPLIASDVSAVSASDGALLVVSGNEIRMVDEHGAELRRWRADVGVSAVARADGNLLLGYGDGSIEVLSEAGDKLQEQRFEGLPSSPVARMAAGPMGSVIAGYADGTLGVWSLEGGVRLAVRKLHGAVTHLLFAEHRLFATTDLGDHGSIDFGTLQQDYCEVLRDVWSHVPVTWESGRAVLAPAPKGHRCAR